MNLLLSKLRGVTASRVLSAAVFAGVTCMPAMALAQAWPAKPVTLVVGAPPGGALDPYARALADELGRQTGGTFVVDNKAGAGGNVSVEHVLKAPADGHTLLIGTAAIMTINPAAFPQLRWKPSDLKAIIKGVEAPLVLVAHPSVPARNFAELSDWIRNPANKVSYASFSPGTPSHFLGHQLNERLKADMVHVPYRGSVPQVTDLLGGQVQIGFTQLATALPHVTIGKLKAFAVTGPQRSRFFPDVPTLAEVGLKDLTATIWFGLFAPAKTPPAVLEAIRTAALKAQAEPAYRKKLEALNFDIPDESGAAFERSVSAEAARWAAVVKATGFKAAE